MERPVPTVSRRLLVILIFGSLALGQSAPDWRRQVDALKAKGDAAGALAALEAAARTQKSPAALEDEALHAGHRALAGRRIRGVGRRNARGHRQAPGLC
jgi:hypothetical protein